MTIELRPIDRIIPYDANAKKHEVQWILNSLRLGLPAALAPAAEREYIISKLIDQPIVVDAAGVIIKGHGRLKAARELGLTEFPCVVRDDLTPEQARLARIADNRSAEGGWDAAALSQELAELSTVFDDGAFDAVGLTNEWAQEIGAAWQSTPPATDDLPELDDTPPVAQRGEVYACGRHRVMCGDATCAADVARLMGGSLVNAILTDPPYGINQAGVTNDAPELSEQMIDGAIRNFPIKNGVVMAFQSTRTFPLWLDTIRHYGFTFERMLWLYKAAQCTFPWRGWLLTSEAILASSIGQANWNEVKPYSHDCYYLAEVSGEIDENIGWHGSIKPLSVVTDLLQRITKEQQACYDPFLGSGTTLMAAESTGRRCFGMEIAPKYVDVILKRFETQTGIRPERIV